MRGNNMNKWYRKPVAKAATLILAILSGSIFITCILSVMTLAGSASFREIKKMSSQPFTESKGFSGVVENSMAEVLNMIKLENLFETDGAYSPDKLIDVMEYTQNGSATGENISGVAYTLEELINWGKDYSNEDMYDGSDVIVCQKPNGSYYYYYKEDFMTQVKNGKLVFDLGKRDQQTFLQGLDDGDYTSSGYYDFHITDEEGNVLYKDCWNFGLTLKERYAPDGAENLLEIVNKRPELNGKLSVIYDDVAFVAGEIGDEYDTYQVGWSDLDEGNTNFTYLYVNETTKKVVTNKSSFQNYATVSKNIETMTSGKNQKYIVIYPKLKDLMTNMNISKSDEWTSIKDSAGGRRWNNTLAVSVDTSFPIQDQFYENNKIYEESIPFLRVAFTFSIVSGILFVILTTWITLSAGRTEKDEELHLIGFDHCKTEIAALIVFGIWLIISVGIDQWGNGLYSILNTIRTTGYGGSYYELSAYDAASYMPSFYVQSLSVAETIHLFEYAAFSFACFFVGYCSLVRRIKAKCLWKDSVLRAVLEFAVKVFSTWSQTLKTVVILAVYFLLQYFAAGTGSGKVAFVLLLVNAVVLYQVLSNVLAKEKLKKGIEEIASGNMGYQIELKGLHGENRKMAEMINGIGEGLNRSVERATKNERLKTDLITNVSHDIKTPLTSIINYVGILKQSDIADPKIQGYLDILEEKAQRLKTLTEDVVEASKVSSGNIVLERMDINLGEMIQQTEGEMIEKFEARNLSVVVNLPEEPAIVHVDGRRMWRVLENIFGNAAKYAMPGTRVYADLRVEEDEVDFSLKNVSEHQLNISANELTERFVRGDISRSTEGSGLGLSIAESLTNMQGGKFELYLDGDLFRVNIRFPRVKK